MLFNRVTKDVDFYTATLRFVPWIDTFPQERQELWLPKDNLRDSSSWSSPPLLLLRDLHTKLISQYDYKEVCAPSQSNGNLRYPNDIDRSLNETVSDKIRKYRADCNNNPPTSVSFMTVITSTSGLDAYPVNRATGHPSPVPC